MDIRPLHTEDEYRAALVQVSKLVDQEPESDTPEGDRLEILSILIEHYESLHHPIVQRGPIEDNPPTAAPERRFGALAGRVSTSSDFDAPLRIEAISEKTDISSTARIIALANAAFGNQEKAMRWLRSKQTRFGGRSPLDAADTEQGARQVEEALAQLDEGYF
jgi:hypothetical protein